MAAIFERSIFRLFRISPEKKELKEKKERAGDSKNVCIFNLIAQNF
jgi:hypothetical protein